MRFGDFKVRVVRVNEKRDEVGETVSEKPDRILGSYNGDGDDVVRSHFPFRPASQTISFSAQLRFIRHLLSPLNNCRPPAVWDSQRHTRKRHTVLLEGVKTPSSITF